MKLKDCRNFSEGFIRIMKEKGIDTKLSYRLAKIQKKCEDELSPLQIAMKPLVEEYRTKNDKGELIIKPEGVEILNIKQDEILEQEVKFEFEPIPVELIEMCKFIEPQIMYFFLPFMDDKEVPTV